MKGNLSTCISQLVYSVINQKNFRIYFKFRWIYVKNFKMPHMIAFFLFSLQLDGFKLETNGF